MRTLRFGLTILFGLALIVSSQAQQAVPKLDSRVTDFTNTLSYAEWSGLEKLLKEFEDTTSNQIVVLVVGKVESGSIEDFAVRVFEQNKIGQNKKNNGVLLLVAKEDREIRIEVGYGLEGALTDAVTSQIVRREMLPKFKDGAYFAGLIGGIDAIMKTTAGEYTADPKGQAVPAISGGMIITAILFFIFVLLPAISSRRRTLIGSGGSRYYSGWGHGGGWPGSFGGGGGSSFGGFSGGGGMSGGGGATGRW
jgi:uncharacterized protein